MYSTFLGQYRPTTTDHPPTDLQTNQPTDRLNKSTNEQKCFPGFYNEPFPIPRMMMKLLLLAFVIAFVSSRTFLVEVEDEK